MAHHLIDYKRVYFWTLYLPPFLQSHSNNFYFYFIEMWSWFTFDFREEGGLYFTVKFENSSEHTSLIPGLSLLFVAILIDYLINIWFWREIALRIIYF